MISRRAFLKGLTISAAGLYLPSTKLIFDMGAHTTLKLIDLSEYHKVIEELYGPIAEHLYTNPIKSFFVPCKWVTKEELVSII